MELCTYNLRDAFPPSLLDLISNNERSRRLQTNYKRQTTPTSPTYIFNMILNSEWEFVLKRLNTHPIDAELLNAFDEFPLHVLCMNEKDPPLNVMKALIDANPDAIKALNCDERTPLTIGLPWKNFLSHDVVKLMLNRCPEVAHRRDKTGRLPLHFASRCDDLRTIKSLLVANPDATRDRRNTRRRCPLHYFALDDASDDAIVSIIQIYPKALMIKDKKGNKPHMLAKSVRVKNLLKRERQQLYEKNEMMLQISDCDYFSDQQAARRRASAVKWSSREYSSDQEQSWNHCCGKQSIENQQQQRYALKFNSLNNKAWNVQNKVWMNVHNRAWNAYNNKTSNKSDDDKSPFIDFTREEWTHFDSFTFQLQQQSQVSMESHTGINNNDEQQQLFQNITIFPPFTLQDQKDDEQQQQQSKQHNIIRKTISLNDTITNNIHHTPTFDTNPYGKLIKRIENRELFFGVTPSPRSQSLLDRINSLETTFFGKPQHGPLVHRLNALFFVLTDEEEEWGDETKEDMKEEDGDSTVSDIERSHPRSGRKSTTTSNKKPTRPRLWSDWMRVLECELGMIPLSSSGMEKNARERIEALEDMVMGHTGNGCLLERLKNLGNIDILLGGVSVDEHDDIAAAIVEQSSDLLLEEEESSSSSSSGVFGD